MATLKGCDVSNWQPQASFPEYNFVIAKATQGTNFRDPTFVSHIESALKNEQKIGAYHFADPATGTTPENEAGFFVDMVRPYLGKIFMFLDWEGEALKYGPSWALRWLKEVEALTGIKPGFYTSASVIWSGGYKVIADNDNALWVAQYTSASQPTLGNSGWDFYALWQYSDRPIDQDIFMGDREAWDKYCQGVKPKPSKPVEPVKPEIPLKEVSGGVYRLYNPNAGSHYWTGDFRNAQAVKNAGWIYEGVAWYFSKMWGYTEVSVLYNEHLQDHLYTVNQKEIEALTSAGWVKQDSTFYSGGSVPVFRLYNPGTKTGQHLFTVSENEVMSLIKSGWIFEGVGFYADKKS